MSKTSNQNKRRPKPRFWRNAKLLGSAHANYFDTHFKTSAATCQQWRTDDNTIRVH
jgi:hypothetical protein